jgi:uncharacterized membrane protein
MTPWLIAVLRAVHVVAGSFWLGAMLLNAGFFLPAVRAAGPAGGQVMRQIVQVRRLPAFLNAAVILTLLTGGILFWRASGGLTASWFSSGAGMGWTIGSIAAIIAALLGHLVNAPTARRAGQLAAAAQTAGGPPSAETVAEMQFLQVRLLRATQLAAILLTVAAVAMGAARYLR